jgi:transposase
MLLIAKGLSFSEICRRLNCTDRYVSVWKRRFEQERLKGLDSRYRGSQRRVRTAQMEAKILEATRKEPSDGTTHWSSYRLAKHLGVSHTTVHRVWRRFGIQPHRLRRYMASDDPQFEEKAADVIGLYLNPPEHAAVFSVDEKRPSRLLTGLIRCCRFPRVGPSVMALSITGMGLFLCTQRSTRAPVKCRAKPLLAIPALSS